MISVSYHLHNICKCIKNSFSPFPATFENVTYNLLAPRVRNVGRVWWPLIAWGFDCVCICHTNQKDKCRVSTQHKYVEFDCVGFWLCICHTNQKDKCRVSTQDKYVEFDCVGFRPSTSGEIREIREIVKKIHAGKNQGIWKFLKMLEKKSGNLLLTNKTADKQNMMNLHIVLKC